MGYKKLNNWFPSLKYIDPRFGEKKMLIAIDPSYDKPIGIAWVKNKKLYYDSIPLDKEDKKPATRDLNRIAKKIFKFIKDLNPEQHSTLVIEGQFFGRNVGMTMKLIELRAMIQGMALAMFPDIEIRTINPRSWQSGILHAEHLKSDEIKKLSIKYASKLVNKEITEDESDAICILKYAEQNWN